MKRQITFALIAIFAVVGVLSIPLTQTAQAESLIHSGTKLSACAV